MIGLCHPSLGPSLEIYFREVNLSSSRHTFYFLRTLLRRGTSEDSESLEPLSSSNADTDVHTDVLN